MNILVIGGGLSPEREVSLCSSTMICNSLIKSGHKAILIDLFFGLPDFDGNEEKLFNEAHILPPYSVRPDAPDLETVKGQRLVGDTEYIGLNVLRLSKYADIVFMGLHGSSGEDGALQALFDSLGVLYTGSGSLGCKAAMDKWQSKAIFDRFGIPSPRGEVFRADERINEAKLPIPCVVKPCSGGSSIGTTLVFDRAKLHGAIEFAFKQEDRILIEQYVHGRELAAGILGDTALPLIEIIPKAGFYDYRNKYIAGLTEEVTPANVDDETTKRIQAAAKHAAEVLGLSVYSRLDFILALDGQFFCLEANTLPGMTPTSLLPQEAQAMGISYDELCQRILALSMEKNK